MKTAAIVYLVSFLVLAWAQTASLETELAHDAAHYLELARNIRRGEGYVTNAHWALNLPEDRLPFPDTYRAPFYPFLVAGFSYVTGGYFAAGKWVSVAAGALLPALAYLFVRRRLGLPAAFAVLAAAIALVNHHLTTASTRALTEAPFAAAALGTLYLATGRPPRAAWGGFVTGIAWLTRYQATILIPACLLAFAGPGVRLRTWNRRALTFLAVTALVISPWLLRTYRVTGSPLHTDLTYHVVSSYDPDRSTYAYFHGVAPAEEPIPYILEHPVQTAGHLVYGIWKLAKNFPRENAGNILYFLLAGAGWILIWRRAGDPEHRRLSGILTFYALLTTVITVAAFTDHRHLTSLDPLVGVFAAVSLHRLWGIGKKAVPGAGGPLRRGLRRAVLALLVAGFLFEAHQNYRRQTGDSPSSIEFVMASEPYLLAHLRPGEAVMAPKPYYISYRLDRPAVSLPWSSDPDFEALARRYRVRFALVSDDLVEIQPYPGSFLATGVPPAWAREVLRIEKPPLRIYEILPDSATAPNGVPVSAGGRDSR